MVEKIKAINNPLTIVAIFAALSEIAGTVALAAVDKSLQLTFIWFVMGFPFALLLLFFATLNFNPMVLYAPSDFQNEENFVKNIKKKTQSVSVGIERVTEQLVEVQNKLTLSLEKVAGEEAKDLKLITENLSRVETELGKVRYKADIAVQSASRNTRFYLRPETTSRAAERKTRRAIRAVLETRPEGSTLDQLLKEVKDLDRKTAVQWLSRMGGIGIVIAEHKDGQTFYRLPNIAEASNARISAHAVRS